MLYVLGAAALVVVLALAAQRRYLTSIADVPGPLLASFSRAWYLWRLIKGDIDQRCISLHEKHGMYATPAKQGCLVDKHRTFRSH